MKKMGEIEIILNDEEFDWVDYGNGFCSLDDMEREGYDDIEWDIIQKLKKVYSENGELENLTDININNYLKKMKKKTQCFILFRYSTFYYILNYKV